VDETGYYLFGLSSDDGAKLYINNKLIINNDGQHGSDDARSYMALLQKGFYPIRVEYFQKDGDKALKVVYLKPSAMDSKSPNVLPLNLEYANP
jgi:hypothetical protein